ncbi:hypothetical protein Y695_04069 [Hydrogenophaga sp. T4]|nr:hypothetical protein Y695_04069 [Hydrogenophaga sp. T4]
MDFARGMAGQFAQAALGGAPVVDAGDVNIVDIEQQATAGAVDYLAQEVAFAPGRADELDVGGRVLQQQGTPEAALHLVDVLAHALQRGQVVGQGQQVVEEHATVAGPGQVFGENGGLESLQQTGHGVQVGGIERVFAADGQAHAVDAQWIAFTNAGEVLQQGATGHEVVFRMHLEETHIAGARRCA